MLAEGKAAPDQNGEELTLSDLRGQAVVVYFHPRAETRIHSVGLR